MDTHKVKGKLQEHIIAEKQAKMMMMMMMMMMIII
jgi:hypothetical protein